MNHRNLALFIAGLIAVAMLPVRVTSQQADQSFTLRTNTSLVLVNVTVRDRQGNFVRDLQPEDFRLDEDGKQQQVLSLDVENPDAIITGGAQIPNLLDNLAGVSVQPESAPAEVPGDALADRRLIVLFFDLSSMQPEEIGRAADSALDYVEEQMLPADLVAIVALDNTLEVAQEFTSDRESLRDVIRGFNPFANEGLAEGAAESTDTSETEADEFTANETEFNVINADRRLLALQSLAETLGMINQRKSVIYFSSGMNQTGIENQSRLRAATNAAVRANVSIYTIDVRGLQAMSPFGDASRASQGGRGAFSGSAMTRQFDRLYSSQETLVTLASDTGGRAFLDSNDFAPAFARVQEDTAMYYVLGYISANQVKDGKFRRITVTVNRRDMQVEHRRGYYAETDFQHTSGQDREAQLRDQLASDLPSTDLPVYLATGYFRLADIRYFVPVSIVVPGSAIPFARDADEDLATLDIIGTVTDALQRDYGTIRETVKYAVDTTAGVRQKNVQYNSGFLLPPGNFHLKVVVRENQTGQVGSFETQVNVPNLRAAQLKISSVVASGQKQAAKARRDNPLFRNGAELIPSVTHVFSTSQTLYLYFEVYEPARDQSSENRAAIKLLTSAAFYKGGEKVFETPLIEANQIDTPDRPAAGIEIAVSLSELQPGFYTCQINVIDDAAGRFVFPRLLLLVR